MRGRPSRGTRIFAPVRQTRATTGAGGSFGDLRKCRTQLSEEHSLCAFHDETKSDESWLFGCLLSSKQTTFWDRCFSKLLNMQRKTCQIVAFRKWSRPSSLRRICRLFPFGQSDLYDVDYLDVFPHGCEILGCQPAVTLPRCRFATQ